MKFPEMNDHDLTYYRIRQETNCFAGQSRNKFGNAKMESRNRQLNFAGYQAHFPIA